ncbi:hypothetical protein AG1IA_06473 [Rhizoctonia solani AG-1 IA]|uniref:Uncharacterized protein n=1 Tax=Thanatephorus cucumeris (strain AG1-IA) TaxID=983506 RepID=L8WMW2_THACA|nr:hypothetical protein AG1IA_06473 [Rhizoctonia solani AG-1 IA]
MCGLIWTRFLRVYWTTVERTMWCWFFGHGAGAKVANVELIATNVLFSSKESTGPGGSSEASLELGMLRIFGLAPIFIHLLE